jgi:long-subunit fatty acid transport protein
MTRQRIRLIAAIAAITATLGPQGALAGDPGSAGALFLRIGMGARASGMGEAFIAVAEDASSVYWNPAAMSAVLGTSVMVMHNEYLQSVRLEQATLTHETDWGTLGLGFTGLYLDNLERRDKSASESPRGGFDVYDVSVTAAFSRYIVPNLSVGLAVKPVWERIDESTATGFAVDAGVYHISKIEGVKFAAVAANLGAPMKFENEEFALPRYVKVGVSYERDFDARGRVLLTLDGMFPNDDDVREHIGVEYGYKRMFYLRSGYKAGYDSQGATFGVGVTRKEFSVDYAVMLIRNDLGDSHRISLAMHL